jgi:broad specificity phosphatase PhoE
MKRSIETAHLLFEDDTQFVQSKLCNEINFGNMEGHTWEEVQNFEHRIPFINVVNDQHSVNPQGCEHFEDLWVRAKKFHHFLFNGYRGKTIMVVSHGVLKGSSCMESLTLYPSNLELAGFCFSSNQLIEDESIKLIGSEKLKSGQDF